MIIKASGWALAVALGVVLASGCSSGDGGSGGGGGSFDCKSGCDKILAVKCPNDTMEKCTSDCETDLTEAGDCAGSLKSLYSCAINLPFTCDASGEASVEGSASIEKCYPQQVTYGKCVSCQSDPSDDPCDTCAKQNCCSELKGVYDEPSFKDYLICYNNCQDQTCESNCIQQYPGVLDKGKSIVACQNSKCASSCTTP